MNQPTREEFKRLEERQRHLEEEVKQLREQRTEEIKVTRVEVASADVLNQLKALEQGQHAILNKVNEKFEQVFQTQAAHDKRFDKLQEDTNITKIQMEGVRADILRIGESQADLRDRLIEHSQHLEAIREQQERNTETLGGLMNFAESHDTLLKSTATKEDLGKIETTMATMATKDDILALKTTQDRQELLLQEILSRLPPKS